jgi:choline dehydrogenase-like flavoprotein
LLLLAHELPDEANRVELHPTLTDDTGIPAPKLIYRRGEHTKKAIAFGLERAKEVVEAAGVTKVVLSENNHEAPGHFAAAPGHYMGTARMGDNPERFVVDKWCRAHDVKNLFIIDGSVFTTSGACTPTSTIQAIALRTADYIKQQTRKLLT